MRSREAGKQIGVRWRREEKGGMDYILLNRKGSDKKKTTPGRGVKEKASREYIGLWENHRLKRKGCGNNEVRELWAYTTVGC